MWWEVFRKAGCPGYLGVLMAIPIVNFVVLIVIIAIDWPIQREVSRLRLRLGEATESDIARVTSEANKQDQRGNWDESIKLHQLIIEKQPTANPPKTLTGWMIESVGDRRATAIDGLDTIHGYWIGSLVNDPDGKLRHPISTKSSSVNPA